MVVTGGGARGGVLAFTAQHIQLSPPQSLGTCCSFPWDPSLDCYLPHWLGVIRAPAQKLPRSLPDPFPSYFPHSAYIAIHDCSIFLFSLLLSLLPCATPSSSFVSPLRWDLREAALTCLARRCISVPGMAREEVLSIHLLWEYVDPPHPLPWLLPFGAPVDSTVSYFQQRVNEGREMEISAKHFDTSK